MTATSHVRTSAIVRRPPLLGAQSAHSRTCNSRERSLCPATPPKPRLPIRISSCCSCQALIAENLFLRKPLALPQGASPNPEPSCAAERAEPAQNLLSRRRSQRLFRTTMARVASHMLFPIRKLRIDLAHHDDHVPRDFLLRVLIAREIALHVAISTLHAETGAKRGHHRTNIGGLQQF